MKLNFDTDVILVGDGPMNEAEFKKLKGLPVIALDGGANVLARMGLGFDYLCGDLDSVVPKLVERTASEKVIKLEDQNFGDLEKTLGVVSAQKIYGFGLLGGRLDHSYEALRVLNKSENCQFEWIGKDERAFIWPNETSKMLREGQRISFLSFAQSTVRKSTGLKYPLDGLNVAPNYISLSNEVINREVQIFYQDAPLIALLGN